LYNLINKQFKRWWRGGGAPAIGAVADGGSPATGAVADGGFPATGGGDKISILITIFIIILFK
jgi:hypothetical protein